MILIFHCSEVLLSTVKEKGLFCVVCGKGPPNQMAIVLKPVVQYMEETWNNYTDTIRLYQVLCKTGGWSF